MANANLLVPGLGSTTFVGKDGNDLGYPIKMQLGVASRGLLGRSAEELVELLSMEHTPGQMAPVKTTLKVGEVVSPGHILELAYNQLPSNFSRFLYDWRADIRHSALRLLDFIEERKPPGGKWNLVGHSLGGLVIIAASKLLPNRDELAQHVASVVLVGCPIAGSVTAARSLIHGDDLGEAASSSFKQILRSWPSLYQALPAWDALVDEQGVALAANQQLSETAAWVGEPHISADHLARAREIHLWMRDPLASFIGVRVAILMARNRRTSVKIIRTASGFDTDSAKKELGDTLVPHDQTLSWIGGHIGRFVKTFRSPCNQHRFLFTDPAIINETKNQILP